MRWGLWNCGFGILRVTDDRDGASSTSSNATYVPRRLLRRTTTRIKRIAVRKPYSSSLLSWQRGELLRCVGLWNRALHCDVGYDSWTLHFVVRCGRVNCWPPEDGLVTSTCSGMPVIPLASTLEDPQWRTGPSLKLGLPKPRRTDPGCVPPAGRISPSTRPACLRQYEAADPSQASRTERTRPGMRPIQRLAAVERRRSVSIRNNASKARSRDA